MVDIKRYIKPFQYSEERPLCADECEDRLDKAEEQHREVESWMKAHFDYASAEASCEDESYFVACFHF